MNGLKPHRLSMPMLLLGSLLALAGCTVGPNYKRPAVKAPGGYRGEAPEQAAGDLGDAKWWEVFQDTELQGLIHTALQNNYDVRIAATRVQQARAQLGITRADQLPSVAVGGAMTNQQSPPSGPFPEFQTTQGQLSASAAWTLDFWGRYRRAPEARPPNL